MGVRRYALLAGVDVVNVVLWDSSDEYEAPAGLELRLAPLRVGPGWQRVDGEWVPPEGPDPDPVPEASADLLAAVEELRSLGMSEAAARAIAGLPGVG